MDDLLTEFLTETSESLEVVDVELVKFEADPQDRATLDHIFRLVHTIKGTCGFLGLPRLEALAHAGETLLGRFRDGAQVAPGSVTLVLQSIDRIKELLSHLELLGVEPEGRDRDLIEALEAMSQRAVLPVAPRVAAADPVRADAPAPETCDASEEAGGDGPYDPELGRRLRPGEVSMAELEAAFQATDVETPVPTSAQSPGPAADAEAAREGGVAAQSIRVNLDVLETLMTTVSELVLTRNQLLQMVRADDDSAFKAPLQRLSAITSELQDGVMKTRMQPIGAAWKKLPRIVRDLAGEVGKTIHLVMEGEDTELDRQVLEMIRDPLTHMVRNSADHGLEATAERLAAGKPVTGTIRLSAVHEGGCIVIRIADDGRGLDTGRIRAKAVAQGLVGAAEATALSDADVHRFIFAPGFSTAEQVTSVSGRGVGMDVVRTNIEAIGGRIELASAPGEGTTFSIRIPLTLAIVSALLVTAGGQRFAIPQPNIRELVRTGPEAAHQMEWINRSPVLRLRDRLLPLVSLAGLLDLDSDDGSDAPFVVVVQAGARRFGVAVDEVLDTEEIVVKPLAGLLRDVSAFTGATILGDGSVVLILDPGHLAGAAGEGHDLSAADVQSAAADGEEKTAMLVVRAGDRTPKAVPLALVTRLEDIAANDIERSAGRAMVQYRGRLMPLLHAANDAFVSKGRQPVLVFTDGDRMMGLAVDEIVDVVEERLTVEIASARPGVIGSAVVQGRATDVLDVAGFLAQAFAEGLSVDSVAVAGRARRVLLVDDNAFFRNMIAPLLAAAGYEVTTAASAEEAWRLHGAGADFDAIVSDLELPDADGCVFAQKVSQDSRWAQAPRIALTGRPVTQSLSLASEGTFNDVIRKSDRQGLIEVLGEALGTPRAA